MTRLRWVVAVVVAGLLALAGCTVPGASVAATVNGTSIDVDQVEVPVAAIGDNEGQLAEPHAVVLSYAIRGVIAREIAAAQNIQLTGEPRQAVLNANASLAQYADNPQTQDFVNDVVDFTIVVNQVGEQAFLDASNAAEIVVNPRYGSWVAQSAAVSSTGGQLSTPWTTPSPQP